MNDGRVSVWFVAGAATAEAIAGGSVTGGVALHCSIDGDGGLPAIGGGEQPIPTTALGTRVETQFLGRPTYDPIEIRFLQQIPDDGIKELCPRGAEGTLIIYRDQASLASPDGAKELYPVVCGQRLEAEVAKNSVHKYSIRFAVVGEPNLNA